LGWEHDCFYSWVYLLRLTHQLILHLPLLCFSSPGFPPCPSLLIEATNGSASCINFDWWEFRYEFSAWFDSLY
jgi:hypothetical protein